VPAERVLQAPGWVRIRLADGADVCAPVAGRFSLGRFDLAGPPSRHGPGGDRLLTRPDDLWHTLVAGLPGLGLSEEATRRFAHELDNSAANYALALKGAEARRAALRAVADGATSTLAYTEARAARDPAFSPLAFYESWVVDGHPLHPGAKLKLGMAPDAVMAYSPEWGAEPMVGVVAIALSACRVHTLHSDGPKALLGRDHPGLLDAAREALAARGKRLDDYELLPMHPWQLAHTLPRLGRAALEDGRLVVIPGAHIATRALMSVRSLAPIGGGHHLKTAINVQTTGAVRTVSPQSAENGCRLSRLLSEIAGFEGGFGGRLVVLAEHAGLHADFAELAGEAHHEVARNMAALVRENPERHVGPGETAMPGAALLARSPLGDRPLASELVARFATANGLPDGPAAAARWLGRYAGVAVPGLITLLARWGIAMEAHLQNCVPVFGPDGGLSRMLVRDFGGVRVLDSRLAPHGLRAALAAGSATCARDADDLRNKLFYPLVQNHLGELIATLVRDHGGPEAPYWAEVAAALNGAYADLLADPAIAEQARADQAALFAPTLPLKAMATMRLVGDVTRYTFSAVPNPLAPHAHA
jgi:siderophore synthetase component